jgi:hypothetical protein
LVVVDIGSQLTAYPVKVDRNLRKTSIANVKEPQRAVEVRFLIKIWRNWGVSLFAPNHDAVIRGIAGTLNFSAQFPTDVVINSLGIEDAKAVRDWLSGGGW